MLKSVYKMKENYRGWSHCDYPFLVYSEKYDGYVFPNRNPGGDYYWVIDKPLLKRMFIADIVEELRDEGEWLRFVDSLEKDLNGEESPVEKVVEAKSSDPEKNKPVNKTRKSAKKKWWDE